MRMAAVIALVAASVARGGIVSYKMERLAIPSTPSGTTAFADAVGIDGNFIAGTTYLHDAQNEVSYHATVWVGPDHRPGLLPTPTDFPHSQIQGVSGDQAVGSVYDAEDTHSRASLWTNHGTTRIDLQRKGDRGSIAMGVSHGVQVGSVDTANFETHAMLWRGSPARLRLDACLACH